MNLHHVTARPPLIGNNFIANGSRTATNLNVAYVHNTSGNAVAIRYECLSADPIDGVGIFMDSSGGTIANITMQCRAYNENTTSRPGTTLRATATTVTVPSANDKWIYAAFGTPYTPAVGEVIWFVFDNTSASPTVDYPGILTATNIQFFSLANTGPAVGYTTTNGFSSSGSGAIETPCFVVQGSLRAGQPFTQLNSAYYTSNTRRRGFVIKDLSVDHKIAGAWYESDTPRDKFQLYNSPEAPGGTVIEEWDLDSDTNETTAETAGTKIFDTARTLSANTEYKGVFTFASSAQIPTVLQIEDHASYAADFNAMLDGNRNQYPFSVIDDGAGGCTEDKAVSPNFGLMIKEYPAASGGGTLAAAYVGT